LIEGQGSAHLTFALRENDVTDQFTWISGGGNYAVDLTYDTNLMALWSDGSLVVGAPAGGRKGYGTINVQVAYEDNVRLATVNDVALKANNASPTMSGNGSINGNFQSLTGTLTGKAVVANRVGDATTAALTADGDAGAWRALTFRTNSLSRWWLGANTVAETGANTGSNLQLYAYDDAGGAIGSLLHVPRATGVFAFTYTPTAPTAPANTNNTQLATTAFVAGQAATAAEQEAAASVLKFVTPSQQERHPSAAKVWAYVNTAGTVSGNYNVTSATDVGVGEVTVVIGVDFSSGVYAVVPTHYSTSTNPRTLQGSSIAAASFTYQCRLNDLSLADPGAWAFAAFGDQT
jgi:hypothetical protein